MLERVLKRAFDAIDGFTVLDSNYENETEEIDLLIGNSSTDAMFQREGYFILIECKNWRTVAVGKNDSVVLINKAANRDGRCTAVFLMSSGKVAWTVEHHDKRLNNGIALGVIKEDQLRTFVAAHPAQRLLQLKNTLVTASMS